jgi:hypothetical protein
MFYKEPLNPSVNIVTLRNKENKILFLRTRTSPPNNFVNFAFDIGPYNGKPLYEVQSKCSIQYINQHLIEKYPDFSFFTWDGENYE